LGPENGMRVIRGRRGRGTLRDIPPSQKEKKKGRTREKVKCRKEKPWRAFEFSVQGRNPLEPFRKLFSDDKKKEKETKEVGEEKACLACG